MRSWNSVAAVEAVGAAVFLGGLHTEECTRRLDKKKL